MDQSNIYQNTSNDSVIKSKILEIYFKIFVNKQLDDNNSIQLDQKEIVLNLDEDTKQKEIQSFLLETQSYLDNCNDYQVINELLITISSCFSFYPNYSLSVFGSFFNKFKFNANYIIIISSILYELTHTNPKIDISEFSFFITDSLKEIQNQVQNIENEKIFLFGHQISPQFANTLILNLLLSSSLTKEIFISFFPYVLSPNLYFKNPKFDSLLEHSLNSSQIFMSHQIDDIKGDLIEILTNQEIHFNINMNEKILSFITCVIYFARNKCQKEIDGLTNENILPFIAITAVYLQKYETTIEMTEKINGLVLNGTRLLNNDCSTLLKMSVKIILNSLKSQVFSIDTSLNMILILAEKLITNEFKDDNEEAILSYLLDFTTKKADYAMLQDFFNSNGKNIFEFIFLRFEEFNDLKLHKLNLSIFNSMEILSHIDYLAEKQGFKQTIYFLENYCYNTPNIISFNQYLMSVIHERIQEKNWDDVLLIAKFIKKNDSSIKFNDLSNAFNVDLFPSNVKYLIFNTEIDSNEYIENLLSFILNDPYPEKNTQFFQILFDKMIEDKEILQSYLEYLINVRSCDSNLITEFLLKFLNEFESHQDIFIDIVNKHFLFNKRINTLYKINFSGLNSLSSNNSNFGNSIISKLLESIESRPNNFQAFICLKNIANSFPFLFIQNTQKVFNLILLNLNNFSLIFDETKVNEQLIMIKTSISSLFFLMTILQSSLIFDKFLNWLFVNIKDFNNSQVFAFILLLLIYFKCLNNASFVIFTYVLKYDFIETLKILLERNFTEDYFKSQYINTICHLISEIYKMMIKLTKFEIIQIEELNKIENPMNYFYENICNSQPLILDTQKIYFQRISNKIETFITDINKPFEFWLSYECKNKKNILTDHIYIFISKLKTKKEINKAKNEVLPFFHEFLTMKMIRYLVMKPFYIYQWFLYGKETKNIPKFNELINETIIELNKMKNKSDDDDDENNDFDLYDVSEFLLPYIEKLVQLITSQKIDSRYLLLFNKLFKNITKNSHALLLFINYSSQYFKEFSMQSCGCDSLPSLKIMHHLIDLFKLLSLHNNFKENLHFFFGYDLIKIALMPKWRTNSAFLMKTLYLVYDYKSKILKDIIHLIGLIILNDSESTDIFTIFKFYDQLKQEEKEELNHLILFKFDREVNKEKMNSIIINYYNKFSSILKKQRMNILYSLLMNNTNYFTEKIDKDAVTFLSSYFNFISPKRDDLIQSKTVINDYESNYISELIENSSPKFWILYKKYEKIIFDIISKKTMRLRKFKFLLEFPELINFNLRSLYFRKKMKKRIKKGNPVIFVIDRDEILESSFNEINHIEPVSLLYQISIQYKQQIGIDAGGILRDWFTKLTRELFNPNLSLFSCSEKSKSYQPNINSNINSNHLQYFRFTGMIIARALIEGICIDTHLTSSFYKHILHREPDLNDLKEVDEELFQSLQSLIDNDDVDSLCLNFTSSEDEFGICKTVPLKENGDEIDVINENKEEYISLLTNYKLKTSIEKQLNEFSIGFDSLISNQDMKIFTPNEIDLLICGVSSINVEDFKNHTEFIDPYNAETPVVKLFFETIAKWDNEQLRLLLLFMTGSSRVPANGFKELCEMSGQSLKIAPGGDKYLLPVARTCFNRIDLPQYETEEELNEKLLFAIKNCDSFDIR